MKKVNFKFKPAFTMLELIFVIVVVGILAAVLIPRMQGSRIVEAANQVVSHIRYTQHLAMQDDKYDTADANWYKKRWQIAFERGIRTNNQFSYSVFADTVGVSNTNPDLNEIAKNPLNPNTLLTGGSSNIEYTNKKVTKALRIGDEYGISDVQFSNQCSLTGSRRIIFDYIGRPMRGSSDYASAYPNANRMITDECRITLVNNANENVVISIEPETGYTRITAINTNN